LSDFQESCGVTRKKLLDNLPTNDELVRRQVTVL